MDGVPRDTGPVTGFEVVPAIDLLGGRVVRLEQGRYDRATEYDRDPAAVAGGFARAGAPRIHVVDLEGARAGRPVQTVAVRRIVEAAGERPVQLGGGLRDRAAVEAALALGVDRVVLGTVALRDPDLVREVARAHPGRIAVGIDAREGRVAVSGWLEDSEVDAVELARCFEGAGVAVLIHTDIARDGMRTGPNVEASRALARAVGIPVIVSGGVGRIEHVVAAARGHRDGLAGVIVGRALYTGDVDLGAALRAVRAELGETEPCS